MYKNIRIAILLTILVIVAGNQWLTGSRFSRWEKPLWITIYPVLVDADAEKPIAISLVELTAIEGKKV